MEANHDSPITAKAVALLNSVITQFPDLLPSSPEKCTSTYTVKSALEMLMDIMNEMEALACHNATSSESFKQPDPRGRISIRRGASREIAGTIVGELKRPAVNEGAEEGGVREHRGSHLRREASSDLSATITGNLKRPPEDREEADFEEEVDFAIKPPRTSRSSGRTVPDLDAGLFSKSESIEEEANDYLANSRCASLARPSKQYADDAMTVNLLDLRVGRILSVSKHETAEKLYCESIDVGEAEPRNIASGLVPYYSLPDMLDRMVVVVCNLKSRNLVGFPSNGMVLCATSDAADGSDRKVELLTPPSDAKPGDRVFAIDIPGELVSPQKCDKKKIFQKVAVDLKVDDCGRFTWDGVVLSVGSLPLGEACTVSSLRNCEVG